MEYSVETLDEFVKEFDARYAQPDILQYFVQAGFTYKAKVRVDLDLDPFSEEYVGQQIALYEEISGRKFNQEQTELYSIDVDEYVQAPNPFFKEAFGALPMHMQRLCKAFRVGALKRESHILDYGPGGGVSSEVAAYLGHKVTAVDINPAYVDLINRRARARGLPIAAVHSAFEDFDSEERYDAALFYESLHHALRPWETLRHVSRLLKPDGKLILAGEPVNDIWWPHWGLRLDSVSVWSIRKFGWFESGWSMPFLRRMLRDAGFASVVVPDGDPEVGPVILGLKPEATSVFPATPDLPAGGKAPPFGERAARIASAIRKLF